MSTHVIRVIQLGNFGSDGGGISSVLREFESWDWASSTHTFVDTYAQDPRLFGLRRFVAATRAAWMRSRYDVAHVHLSQRGSFIREGVLVRLVSWRRRPVVVTIHGSSFVEYARDHQSIVKSVLSRANRTAVLSPHTKAALTDLGVEGVVLVPNGVSQAEESGISGQLHSRSSTVIFAGEFSRRKGADILLAAWPAVVERLPSATLLIFGEPKDVRPELVSGVKYMGRRPRAEVRAALERSRLVVLPSRAEAFPMSLLEAMAAGLPVVATDVGGVAEMLDDRDQLVAPDSPADLSAKIGLYLSDLTLSDSKGQRNRSRYAAKFSPKAVSTLYDTLYRQALETGS